MTIKTALIALLLALLPGCQVAGNVAAPVAPAQATRHLLDVSANQTEGGVWGVNFGRSDTETVYRQVDDHGIWYTRPFTVVHMDYTTTGAGTFEDLGNNRLLYTVPAGQVLVINEISNGDVRLNGLDVGVGETVMPAGFSGTCGPSCNTINYQKTENRITVHYVFDGGQTVLLNPDQNTTISGYTTSASGFGGGDDAK